MEMEYLANINALLMHFEGMVCGVLWEFWKIVVSPFSDKLSCHIYTYNLVR